MRLIGRPGQGKPSPMLARLLAVRTDTKQARRPSHPQPDPDGARDRAQRTELRRQAAQDRPQSGAPRRARAGPQAAGVGLDRRAGRAVAPDRSTTVTGDGLDTDAHRRVPGRDRRRVPLRAVAPDGVPRAAAPEAGGLPWEDIDLDQPRPPCRAGSQTAAEMGRRAKPVTGVVAARRDRLSPSYVAPQGPARMRLLWARPGPTLAGYSPSTTARSSQPHGVSQRFDRLVARTTSRPSDCTTSATARPPWRWPRGSR